MAEPLTFQPIRKAQIFTGNANPELAQAVAAELDTELTPSELEPFADGEIRCRLEKSVRGNYVFVIQPHGGGGVDPNIAFMEQLLLCDAAKGGSADKVVAICPYLGYSRQDRKSRGREPISAKFVLSALKSSGADSIVAVDLHANQIQGFFDGPVDNLPASPFLRKAIRPKLLEGVVVVSPDEGRVKDARDYRDKLTDLKAEVAYIDKSHPPERANHTEAMAVIGNVAGRQCLLIDDMIDTAGSLSAAAKLLEDSGASEVLAIATHAVLSGKAIDNLAGSVIKNVVVTDTRALTKEQAQIPNLSTTSVAKLIAEAIKEIFTDGSISNIFARLEANGNGASH